MSYAEYGSIENLRTSYRKSLEMYERLLKEWESVTFNYKKDGGHFANLQKNFSGARVYQKSYSTNPIHKELTVSCRCNLSGYQSDTVSLYEYGGYGKADRALSVDEIIEKIQQRKAQIAGYIAGYLYKLDNLDQMRTFLDNVQSQVDSLPKDLRNDARYMLKEYYFHS